MKKQASKKRVVKGIEHGLSGYTNHRCRCNVCTQANAEQSREYRARRYAGNPLCIFPRCPHTQSRAHNNGLCHRHGEQLRELRTTKPRKARQIENMLGLQPHPRMLAAA